LKPIIGITGVRHVFPTKLPGTPLSGVALSDDYARGVEQAGGIPFVIPYLAGDDSIRSLAERLDGLLLSGGNDVDPLRFGVEPKVGLSQVSPERDTLEFSLLHEMKLQNKPILGICRGIQVINAAFGGNLYQDLPRHWRGSIQHSQQAPRNHFSHTIHIQPESCLSGLLGGVDLIRTNSFHHQAVEEVAKGFVATAWDDEGLTEGMEALDGSFLVAVQWHPENLWRDEPKFLGLFRGLVEAASARL
jgi:putative glutamine amidotransferase